MAETPKKTKTTAKTATAAKPRKAANKKGTDAAAADPIVPNGHAMAHERGSAKGEAGRDEVARLAHRFWQERGRRHGHHEEDWYRAEQELRGRAS
jgi:hypothetical protein